MREIQRLIVAEMGVADRIDPAAETERRVAFLSDYLAATGARGYVLGISGGLDSTLAGRLAQLAVERRRAEGAEATFVAVRLPYDVQHDEDDARAALEFVAADEVVTYDVGPAVDAFSAQFRSATGHDVSDFTKGNTKARLRMVAQYALAGDRGLLVLGTDHGAEAVTGFFTKFGDGAADVVPLVGLDKRQNREVLRSMGASERLWSKAPTADLLDETPGREDEDELGLSYEDIDTYVEGGQVPDDVAERIEAAWRRSRHKRTTPVTPQDVWWAR
jgi:NAD+ synthase